MDGWVVPAALAVGVGHIAAHEAGRRVVAGILKALPILVLTGAAASAPDVVGESYRWWIVAGLVFSMVGDLCLLSESTFVPGLGSFLLGHCCYLAAFGSWGGEGPIGWATLLVIGGFAVLMIRVLWPHLDGLRVPVLVYMSIISLMLWRAVVRATGPATPDPSGMLAAVGATSFVVSDSILALDRFRARFAHAHTLVMITYYGAQLLIARSVLA